MDEFMGRILGALREHGARAVRVFPPEAGVLLSFADRLATELVRTMLPSRLVRKR
jgi:recyclin-1